MFFQVLDDKSECIGIYCGGQLYFDPSEFPRDISKTWKYSSYLRGHQEIEYASLYVQGADPESFLPEYLNDDWEDVKKRLSAVQRSLDIAKVSLWNHCIYDLTPRRFLEELCEVRNKITQHVFQKFERPARYPYLLKVCQMLEGIADHPLKINRKYLRSYSGETSEARIVQRLLNGSEYIRYNQFGTKTGRLTTHPGSFPILTLKKSLRSVIEPHNDCFIELDFNGAELRTLLALGGKPQPDDDIHQWNADHIYGERLDRDAAKKRIFAWLYNPSSADDASAQAYQRDLVLDTYWDGETVRTPFHREIKGVDRHHALNYIVQSTTAELTLLQAMKIDYLLRSRGCRSRLSCIIHDAIIIDFAREDEYLLESIKKLMRTTKFGDFKININRGKDLGHLIPEEL